MTETQLLFAGPVFAMMGLIFFFVPALRPRIFCRAIICLAICMCVPMAAGFGFRSYNLVTIGFVMKPITASLGAALFIAHGLLWRSERFPFRTTLPIWMILIGAIADIHAIQKMADGWDGAHC